MTACNIYDLELERVGTLYTWLSLVWEEHFNEVGTFQIELQATENNTELIQKDRYVGCDDSDTLMLIESVEIADGKITANGFPATKILEHRVSVAEISNINAETAMRQLVSDMNPWERVGLGDVSGFDDKFTPQISDKTVEEYCENIAQACDLGFKFVHNKDSKTLDFTVYRPKENPDLKFSTLYGNVGDIIYTLSDVDYKNVAIVAGAGEGDERVTVIAGDTDSTGSARREMYCDARQEQPSEGETDAEYRERLIAYGEGKLIEQAQVENIEFAISEDVGLGEIVFVWIPEINVKMKTRVTGIIITNQNNVTTKEISVGTPIEIRRA